MRLLACLALILAGSLAPLRGQDDKAQSYETTWYPLKVGNKWTYRAANDQQVVVQVDSLKQVALEIKDTTSGKMTKSRIGTYLLKITSADKVMSEQVGVLTEGTYRLKPDQKEVKLTAGVYRFQAAGKDINPPECFLKLPLAKDDSWDVNCESESTTIKGSYVGGEATIKVPAAGFQTMTVTSKNMLVGTQPLEVTYWFAERVGMVKERVQMGSYETLLELLKFEPAK